MEIDLIAQYKSNNPDYGYNLSLGGEGGVTGARLSIEQRHAISVRMKGNQNRVHKNSTEERKRISKRMKGNNFGAFRNITDEYRDRALTSQPNRCVIEQYTLDGKLVARYRSINEAFRQTGIYNIAEASKPNGLCSTAGGYRWARKGN